MKRMTYFSRSKLHGMPKLGMAGSMILQKTLHRHRSIFESNENKEMTFGLGRDASPHPSYVNSRHLKFQTQET